MKEVFHAFVILLRCCVTEKSDLELAFKEKINNSEVIKISRFLNIVPQLGMRDEEFDELLRSFHKVNLTFVIPPFFSTVDESTIAWTGNSEQKIMRRKSKKKKNKLISTTHEDAPNTVLIPTKPHPVSILLNGDCFWTDKSKKPFCSETCHASFSKQSHFSSSYVEVVTSISIQGIDTRVECRQRLWQF